MTWDRELSGAWADGAMPLQGSPRMVYLAYYYADDMLWIYGAFDTLRAAQCRIEEKEALPDMTASAVQWTVDAGWDYGHLGPRTPSWTGLRSRTNRDGLYEWVVGRVVVLEVMS